jgi:hypothetical protein
MLFVGSYGAVYLVSSDDETTQKAVKVFFKKDEKV